ncbi:MAG: DNA primase, partial [Flavisolibacter sp.]|nr:DNA primase [Flavisolibacter sp.]
MIAQTTIQQIISRLDAVEVIGSFVKLKKRGANYLGLCPFHHEKTPSFTVSPSKEIFKCFGCGKSGNTISFLMEHEKLSYVEALRWLANKYGVEVEETNTTPEAQQQYQVAESLYIINQFAQQFYEDQLFNSKKGKDIGLAYLKERGFTDATIRKFGLGYAPDERDAFTQKALALQYNKELLQKAGLITERNNQFFDTYRDRIIFPVHNSSGKVIGFGARLIKSNDKAPKYINTPENELYVKSRIVYGLYQARQFIVKSDECLLVEGYTDVLSLHQAGIENVVASGGTSLTQEQLRLIKKHTKNLTIIYDGDPAGVKAALRGLDMALEESLNVKLVLIPDGEDPDSYVQKIGAGAFRKFVAEHKKDFILFQLDVLLKETGEDSAKKAGIVNRIAETISKIDKTEEFTKQQDYIRQCAQILKIDEGGFTSLVNKFIRNRIAVTEKKVPFEEAQAHQEKADEEAANNFDDATFDLLYKDELQEREIIRVLLEHGTKQWDSNQTIAEYIFSELPDEDLFEDKIIIQILALYKQSLQKQQPVDKSYFIYNTDNRISTLAVSLLHFPYEESYRWKTDFSQSTGYQQGLFEQDYKSFLQTISKGQEEKLHQYLKIKEDTTADEVESAINYLKLRKIKFLLLQNQSDLEKADAVQQPTLIRTHQHLKQMEIELSK